MSKLLFKFPKHFGIKFIFIPQIFYYSLPLAHQKFTKSIFKVTKSNHQTIAEGVGLLGHFMLDVHYRLIESQRAFYLLSIFG